MDTPPVAAKKTLLNSFKKTSLTPCRRLGLGRPSPGSMTRSLHEIDVNTSVRYDATVLKDSKPNIVCNENEKIEDKPFVPNSSSNLNKSSCLRVRRCLTTGLNTPSKCKSTVKRIYSDNDSDVTSGNDISKCRLMENNTVEYDKQESKFKKNKLDFKLIAACNEECDLDRNTSNLETQSQIATNIEEKENITSDMIQQLVSSVIQKKKRLEELKVQSIYVKKHNLEELRAQTAKWRKAGQEALRYAVSLAKDAGYSVRVEQLMSQHGFPPHLMRYNADDDEFD